MKQMLIVDSNIDRIDKSDIKITDIIIGIKKGEGLENTKHHVITVHFNQERDKWYAIHGGMNQHKQADTLEEIRHTFSDYNLYALRP